MSNLPPRPTLGERHANNASEEPMTRTRKARMNTPRAGSVAKACTEVSTPERTRKVPSRLSEKVRMASSTVQLLKPPRFSVTASEWISAVPTRSEEHTSELQSRENLVCRLLLEKKNSKISTDSLART